MRIHTCSTSIELLINEVGSFNEKYAAKENEKTVFSIEYAEFHWNTAEKAGFLHGNRYGLVRVARELMLTAAVSESEEAHSKVRATAFEDGSDEVIILKKKPAKETKDTLHIEWKETQGAKGSRGEISDLENILELIDSLVDPLDGQEQEPANIAWDEHNRAAFLTGTENALLLLAREFIQFALSATSGDRYEVKGLQGEGLVLVFKDNCGEHF
jgi:hypothetical protein